MGRYVTYRAFLIVVVVLALAFISYKYLLPVFENTSMYLRLYGSQAAHAAESNEGRILLYRQAYKDFLSSPFFGIGFKNFAVKHGAYTHSAYAEVLACTGIFGVLLYFTSYIKTWSSLNNAIVLSKYKFDGSVDQQYLIKFMFYVFLFIGLGIGHLYDNISMLELGIFMASGAIAKIQYGEAENHS
jgi:O-antigen ligase